MEEWIQAARGATAANTRVFVGMNQFGGERRFGVIQSVYNRFSKSTAGWQACACLAVDLDTDSRWDPSHKATFYDITQLAAGFVDLVIGSPPCSRVSFVRLHEKIQGLAHCAFSFVLGKAFLT